MMKKTFINLFAFILVVAMLMSVTSCSSNSVNDDSQAEISEKDSIGSETVPEPSEVPQKSEEEIKKEFLEKYELLLTSIELLNSYSDYVGAVHVTVWDSVGPKEVAKYVEWLKDPDEKYAGLICKAFGVSSNKEYNKKDSIAKAKLYNEYLEGMGIVSNTIDELFKDIKNNYNFNIDEVKEYYLESSAYAEYARGLEGSYISYSQALNDYKKNIEKYKKAAEIAY